MTLYHHTPAVAVRIMSQRRMVSAAPVDLRRQLLRPHHRDPARSEGAADQRQVGLDEAEELAKGCVIAVSECRSLFVR